MILLEQFKHDPPCWEAKVKGDPPTSHMEVDMTPLLLSPPPLTLK